MDPEECSGVAISEFHGGIHGDHVGGDAGGIGTRLNSEMVEFDALDEDIGLHGSAGAPEDEREEGEEEEEAENEGEEIVPARERAVAIFVLEKTLFFDDVDVLVPRQLVAAGVVVDLAGAGETAGGGVRVRRRTHWAEHRR